ncbi:carboxylesterase [Stappia sp. ES.058]|uniref:alpha/beta hydrolase n=1 Tax=Stappia sp. ES.058 TaxID=1881061 RepID=UPI00087C9A4C|nr:alpha/beta hydrolase [Stappia sp. ES.058]SDT88215.1 Pimeloyl-ACP methyl ester carboxylesterase [Stappia sp. ES.058]
MQEGNAQTITVGTGSDARDIAVLREDGAPGCCGILWLSGFKSDMSGTKAEEIAAFARKTGRAVTRLDYSGHGLSGGDFEDGTISRWAEEAVAVFERVCREPTIVVGSSMGGWIALLLARALKGKSDLAARLAGMVLIAPAPDFTEELMWKHEFTDEIRATILREGRFERPSEYDDSPYVITRALIEDGRNNLLLGGPIETGCPVTILQGQRDDAVPWRHALRLVDCLALDDVVLTLIKDGDHRLSRPADIARLIAAIDRQAEALEAGPT